MVRPTAMPPVINWVIFILGCAAFAAVLQQRKAIKKHKKDQAETWSMFYVLLIYLEAQARAARDRPGNHPKPETSDPSRS